MPESANQGSGPKTQRTEATRISPDIAEEEHGDPGPDSSASFAFHDQPIVGLGGSAGSIAPLQSFFAHMPADTGMAFVVVLHLSPEHESALPQILQRSTKMVVTQVRDRVEVKPNSVYVIPPAKHLMLLDGHLALSDLKRDAGKRVAVDLFFRTLADTHGPHSVAIVLSGADSDGAIGIKRIKERGGLTIAQDPQESEHLGMPRAAIETGMVDWILRVGEMPARIVEFRRTGRKIKLPDVAETGAASPPRDIPAMLRDVLAVLRARTGRDFSTYKHGTLLRRIARRMQVNGLEDLTSYHNFLRTNPGETGALLQDLLISVTNFFRDRDAFESLETTIPELFKGKGPSDTVRVWVTACATGEEAYSVAILLCEHAARLEAPPRLQVFATDIDESAIAVARAAHYPETIMADVSEERLRRFFVRQQNHYRVNQAVRELVLFAVHDILRDAPFSQLDLVSCRNLLIYLNRDAQRRCFDLFHFALRPGGHLFLGTSETAEDVGELFTAVHKKHRIYQRRAAQRTGLPIPSAPLTLTLAVQAQQRAAEKIVLPAQSGAVARGAEPLVGEAERRGMSASELHFRLIEALAPPSVVVNRESQIVHLSPNAGRFLQFTGGEPSTNLLQLVHPMLRVELRAALFRASEAVTPVDIPSVPLELEAGVRRFVDISVRSAPNLASDLYLVVFNERQVIDAQLDAAHRPPEAEGVVRSLERELELLKQHLRSSAEQHGATTEEMKASNEELQAMNEELRSAAEELETSREELQSINEELATVNLELKGKVDELGRTNSDLQNLMAATNIATIFVDRALNIKRYTPSAVAVFHLIPTDIGRPLVDLRHRLEFDTIVSDAQHVLDSFTPSEREMRAASGRWFLVRIMPYRNSEESIMGVVLTFVDITERKRAEEELRDSEARFRGIVDQTGAGICLTDAAGRLTFANPRLSRMLGWSETELLGKSFLELTHPEALDKSPAAFEGLLHGGATFQLEQRLVRKDGTSLWATMSVSAIRNGGGRLQSCVAVVVDIAARKEAEDGLQNANTTLERRVLERTAELNISNQALRAEISERERAEAAREEMRRALVLAQEAERGRISRELHDEVGQHVTALLLGLRTLEKDVASNANAVTVVQSLRVITENIGEEIHEVALELRPTALDDLGLVRALSTFLEEWSTRTRIQVQFDHADLGEARLPTHVETTLYRVICEAVHNALKHAKAKAVSVILQRKKDSVIAIVEDDGVGFDATAPSSGAKRKPLGLVGMRERLILVDGELTLESAPGRGTTVIARVPLTTT
jgi:two-component system CheB/CheR fusion protein